MTSPDVQVSATTGTDVRVGVRLPPDPERLGEWLADASSFDAAGAYAIWVEPGTDSGLDPLPMVAALAVATRRSRLVLPVAASALVSAHVMRGLDTVRRLSNGRLTLLVADPSGEIGDRVGELPVLTSGVESDDVDFECSGPGDAGEPERWVSVPPPQDRASWLESVAAATARGASGVVVGVAPVLLDILRNPRPSGDRREMQLAQG